MRETLNITKALADPNRILVLMILQEQDELCVCQIMQMMELAPATVSRHMDVLHNAQLVTRRKEGRWVYYSLSDAFPPLLLDWLKESLSQSNDLFKYKTKACGIITQDINELCKTQKVNLSIKVKS